MIDAVIRPWGRVCGLPPSTVQDVASCLQAAGAEARHDVVATATLDLRASIAQARADLSERWGDNPPRVVHSFGLVATAAAVAASAGDVPVVATFDERPTFDAFEAQLAAQVDGVLPLSAAERRRWHGAGVRTASAGALGLPVRVSDPNACPRTQAGHVLTFSTGPTLDAVISSMWAWRGSRLVVLGRMAPSRRAEVEVFAASLGHRDRIDLVPPSAAGEREALWRGATLLVSGTDGARHAAHVVEAAAHGVPAVAVAWEAHLDHVVPGVTGLLVDLSTGPRGLGRAIATLLQDPTRIRAYGAAALARAQALSEPRLVGLRLLRHYDELLGGDAPDDLDAGRRGSDALDEREVIVLPARPAMAVGRERLVIEHLPLAHQLARRYAYRGQPLEDLVQVAALGLVLAAHRFDPEAGAEFAAYAVPTMLGELRRHFRDHAWALRVPRGMQEATLEVQRAVDRVQRHPGPEDPTVAVAAELGMSADDVRAARRTGEEAMSTRSLDLPVAEGSQESIADRLAYDDPDLARVDDLVGLRAALRRVPVREREILVRRFFGENSQTEIASALGLSQVHVSRLLTRTLATLRDHVLHGVPLPRAWAGGPSAAA